MSSSRIDPSQGAVQVDTTRTRQTAAPATPFKDVLAGGANALLTGAEVAGGAMGGPVVAAAIRQARSSVADAATGPAGGGGGASGVPGADAVAGATSQGGEMAAMHAMNMESQQFNMQMLQLQEEVQTENRRFTTLSNVVRARHDTAKAAVGNIRS
jgi:hypothetical protein